MTLSTILQFATLLSVLAAILGLIFSVRAHKRQLTATFLLEYTKRVDEIMRSLPPGVWGGHVFAGEEIPKPSVESRLAVMRCLNLIAQLYYFTRQGYFPKQLWQQHQATYARILASPLFVREWAALAPIFAGDPEFCQFVNRTQQPAP